MSVENLYSFHYLDLMRQPFCQTSTIGRIAIVLGGLSVLATGLHSMLRGNYSYENWWGGLAFAPLAVIGGGAIIVAALFPRLRNGPKAERRRRK